MTITREVLTGLYIDQNMTIKDVAKSLGVSVGSIYNKLKGYGIKKSRSEYPMTDKQIKHLKELQKIAKGRTLSEERKKEMAEKRRLKEPGHIKIRADGYRALYYPTYPSSSKDGYIMEHVYIMEQHIGRQLKKGEVVHHKNHNRADNRIENLEIMTFKEHSALHIRERHKNGEIRYYSKPVINNTTGEVFNSIREAAAKHKVSPSSIRKACVGEHRHSANCKWSYLEGSEDLSIQ